MDEFYVGYLGNAPDNLRRRVRLFVGGILLVGAATALLFAAAQHNFADSKFDFGNGKEFRGILRQMPYPHLAQESTPSGATPPTYVLVGTGKHGAARDLHDGDFGKVVRIKGTLIERQEGSMIEIVPGSVVEESPANSHEPVEDDLGEHDLAGEIVDTKCFLGVMNPGEGKVHRECAALCVRGGIPPTLVTQDIDGHAKLLLLTDEADKPLPYRAYFERVGQPVRARGHVVRSDGLWYLRTSSHGITALR